MLESCTYIVGNLARDPVLDKATTDAHCRFTVLVKAKVGGKSTTEPVEVIARGHLARNAHASLRSGERVIVIGRLSTNGPAGRATPPHIVATMVGHDLRWATSRATPITGDQIRASVRDPRAENDSDVSDDF